MHIHLDAVGGVAGDMFLAAILNARPDLGADVLAAIRAGGLPRDWTVELLDHKASGLTGARLRVEGPAEGDKRPAHTFKAIRSMILGSDLSPGVAERAVSIFSILAEAEGAVHGRDPEEVHFHEVADWDSVADIVGAAATIEALGAGSWSVSPLPLGSGRVKTAHGLLPVPAPATAKLLKGFELIDDGIPGERVTPTGAAILKHLSPKASALPKGRVLGAEGTGFGTRELKGIANILRALIFESAEPESRAFAETGRVAVIEFDVDDQTSEDLATGLDKIRQQADVLDVVQATVYGKKGRLAIAVRVLCRPDAVDAVAETCFLETTTIGLRWHLCERLELRRENREATGLRVKVVGRPGGQRSAKAEADDLAGISGGQEQRRRARIGAEDEILSKRRDSDEP
ncbi:MAG: LarC family nickel insertion protein [Rhodospirillales bacterium]|nr:LarC family nickel insertion protein [Rhodospirillales bacterium]